MAADEEPILVAACGNAWAGDDALGPEVTRRLRHRGVPGTQVVDLGMSPCALLDVLGRRRALLVVDAVRCPGVPPGRLVDVNWAGAQRPALMHDDALSSHGLSLASQLELARALGLRPEAVRLIGLTIEATAPGGALGPAVRRRIPAVVRRVRLWCTTYAGMSIKNSGTAADTTAACGPAFGPLQRSVS